MVLRINCPCGAPYTLGDHLAGRTFKCPACQVLLKVGSPAAPPPGAPGLAPPQTPQQPRPAAPAAPPASPVPDLDLADLKLVDEDSDMGEAPPQKPSGRQKGASGRQRGASGRQKGKSGRQRGNSARSNKTSGSRRGASSARNRATAREPEHEWEDDYGGGRNRGGGGLASIAQSPQVQSLIKGVVALAALGILGFFVHKQMNSEERPTFDKPPPKVAETPPTKNPVVDPVDTDSETPKDPPAQVNTDPTVEVFVPEGALSSVFEAVRDASDPFELDTVLNEAASQDGAAAAAQDAQAKSSDARYKERMDHILLRAGDPAERWVRIEKALASKDPNAILHAARAALDLETPEAAEALDGLELRTPTYVAAAWVAAVREAPPEPNVAQNLKSNLAKLDELGVKLLEPVLLWAGNSDYLLNTAPWLGHSDVRMLELARRALSAAAGGSGPGEEAGPEAWREWAENQGTARELYLRAADEVDLAGAYAARLEIVSRGPAALDFLPLFIRERAASSSRNGVMNLAAGLVRHLGHNEPERVKAVLDVLTKVYSKAHGDWVISAALASNDADVAYAAVQAMQRGTCSQGQTEHMPALALEPEERAKGPLSSLPNHPDAVLITRALFRDRKVLDHLFRGVPTGLDKRYRAGALLAGDEIDSKLQDMLGNEAYPPQWARGHAMAFFWQCGTERSAAFAEELLIKQPGDPEVELLLSVGTPESTGKLRRKVDKDGQLTHMRGYAGLVGAKCTGSLQKRLKETDPFIDAAKQVLMRYGEGRKAAGLARELAQKYLDSPAANNRLAAPPEYVFWGLSNAGGKKELKLFADALIRALPRVRPKDRATLFAAAALHASDESIAECLRGSVLPGKSERALAACALGSTDDELPNLEDAVGSMGGVAASERPTEDDMAVFAALAAVDPVAAAETANEVMERVRVVRTVTPNSQVGFAMGLTLAGKHEFLREFTYGTTPGLREAVARGIALAAQRKGKSATAPPVLAELLLDGDPRVHAEAAVAAAFFGEEGALKEVGAALGAPMEALDHTQRTSSSLSILTVGTANPQSLRSALWDAYAVITGEDVPVLEHRWSLARGVEGSHELRAKALGKK